MDDHPSTVAKTPAVPRYVALLLLVLAIAAGSLAIFFAAEAAEAAADADLLKDGVDRSRLSREEAVGIARLAQQRSTPVPEGERHNHDHDAAPPRELTAEEQAAFDEQWATATGSIHKYDTIAEVEAAGYVLASGNSDGAGVHYVKWSIVGEPFDPAEPSMLLFEELVRGEEMELIAYSYWVSSDGPPKGFLGEEDSWHRHLGVCFVNGYIKDENVLSSQCPGDWVNGMDLWMLHAWVVPGLENDYGRFHTVNPFLCERACGLEN